MSKIKILLLLILLISLIIELYRLNQNTHTGCFFNWSSPKNHKYGKKLKYQNWSSPKIHKCGKKFKYQNWSSPKIHIRH